jgi:hypothetical protein
MPQGSRFVPALFDLYEFEDRTGAASQGTTHRRWFSHFDGLIGAPAEEVILGWSNGDMTVLVCTSGRFYDEAEARFRAAHVALGGDALPLRHRPESPQATFREIHRIESADDLWFEAPGLLTDGPPAQAALADGFSIGYKRLDDGMIFTAATGVDPHQLKVRKVQDWQPYDLDARTSFPLTALDR